MKLLRIVFGRGLLVSCQVLASTLLLTGCGSQGEEPTFTNSAFSGTSVTEGAATGVEIGRFHIGDLVTVTLIGPSYEPLPVHEERIKEDGTITMQFIGPVKAVGKSAGELQKEIHGLYVPRFYTRMTVTVKPLEASYSIGGEVKQEGPKGYIGETTLTKAIQAGGGFTDFANKKKIKVTRNKKTTTFNWFKIQDKPGTDPLIIPGDSIHVPRRWPG